MTIPTYIHTGHNTPYTLSFTLYGVYITEYVRLHCAVIESRTHDVIGIPEVSESWAHPLDCLSRLDCSTTKRAPMPKRAVFERSRRELSLDVSVGVHISLVVEQSSLESQSRGCANTPDTSSYSIPEGVIY